MQEVCTVCYKFLQTIYDKKKMKDVSLVENKPCKSMYHKKLVDRWSGKFADFAPGVRFAVKVIKVRAAQPARVVNIIAVGRVKGMACKLLALAGDTPAAAQFHGTGYSRLS